MRAVMQPPPPTPPPAHVIVEPTFAATPDGNVLGDVYPEAALQAGVTGSALMDCRVSTTGAAEACAVLQEAPAGLGFGGAAVLAARTFRFTPQIVDGRPTSEGHMVTRLEFKFPSDSRLETGPVLLRPLAPGEPAPSARTVKCPDRGEMLCVSEPFAWAEQPSAHKLSGLYGVTVMSCRIGEGGAMQACASSPLTPDAHQQAAAYWGRRFKAPLDVGGRPTLGLTVQFYVVPPGRLE